MPGTRLDFDRAKRYYDSDEEEEAVRIIDRLLDIENLSAKDAIEKLKSWRAAPDASVFDGSTTIAPGDDLLLADMSRGQKEDYTKWGYVGLVDALGLRSRALAAIMLGSSNRDKNGFFSASVTNAQIVMSVFSELNFIEEAKIWCVAAQPVALSGDPEIATMSPAMHYFAIEKYPQLRNAANVRHFVDTTLKQVARHHRDSSEFTNMMQRLAAAMEPKGDSETRGRGFLATLFSRKN